MMQALIFATTGDLAALKLTERPDPVAAPGEAVVEVMAAGLNPSDVKNVLGFFPAYTTPPRIPGRDFSGVVRSGPPELVGRRVWGTGLGLGFTTDGSHAELVKLPAAGCAPMPENSRSRRPPPAAFPTPPPMTDFRAPGWGREKTCW